MNLLKIQKWFASFCCFSRNKGVKFRATQAMHVSSVECAKGRFFKFHNVHSLQFLAVFRKAAKITKLFHLMKIAHLLQLRRQGSRRRLRASQRHQSDDVIP